MLKKIFKYVLRSFKITQITNPPIFLDKSLVETWYQIFGFVFWYEKYFIYPPANHFNCRSIVEPIDENVIEYSFVYKGD